MRLPPEEVEAREKFVREQVILHAGQSFTIDDIQSKLLLFFGRKMKPHRIRKIRAETLKKFWESDPNLKASTEAANKIWAECGLLPGSTS